MSRITKQQHEIQLQQIFRMLLESKTQEEIAKELNVNVRTIQRYTQEIDIRYGQMQRQKTDDTLFTECQFFKNRLLTLYKILESKASDVKVSGTETAKCCEVAANIAIDVLKMESEGIRVVTEIISRNNNNNTNKGGQRRGLANLGSQSKNDESNIKEYNDNRKF